MDQVPAAGCQKSGLKVHFSNFYNRSLKAMVFIDSLQYNPLDIIQSYLLNLKVFVDSMQLVSNCYNFGLITENTLMFIQRPLYPCSRIENNPMMPMTRLLPSVTPQLLQDFIKIT